MKFEDLAISFFFGIILITIGIVSIGNGGVWTGGGIDMTNPILGLIFLVIGIPILAISIILVIGKLLIGEAKAPAEPKVLLVCPKCKAHVSSDLKFCSECGEDLKEQGNGLSTKGK